MGLELCGPPVLGWGIETPSFCARIAILSHYLKHFQIRESKVIWRWEERICEQGLKMLILQFAEVSTKGDGLR